eukprot:gb/GECH01011123.1/.p1 GENE.gb/GECH01011123.1/~~gb/GECH01011123.1/.p1  ORF type:complete len:213 (+),score=34.94 gb/GECH01011123.1/:1-639(+)
MTKVKKSKPTKIKRIIVDANNHLIGRLASVVAKHLLQGHKITILRCERLVKSGTMKRNKHLFSAFLRKRMNTNPKKGPLHFRAPSRMFYRCVRSNIPYRTSHGKAAIKRLKAYDGVPLRFAKKHKTVVPSALVHIALRQDRQYVRIGDLASKFGWKYGPIIKEFDEYRKTLEAKFGERIKKREELLKEAADVAGNELKEINNQLAEYGFYRA